MSGHRNPRPREETRPGGLLNHAGMSPEARLAVAYEEISAICRSAEMDRYGSTEMRALAHQIKLEMRPVWDVICELADARMKEASND